MLLKKFLIEYEWCAPLEQPKQDNMIVFGYDLESVQKDLHTTNLFELKHKTDTKLTWLINKVTELE